VCRFSFWAFNESTLFTRGQLTFWLHFCLTSENLLSKKVSVTWQASPCVGSLTSRRALAGWIQLPTKFLIFLALSWMLRMVLLRQCPVCDYRSRTNRPIIKSIIYFCCSHILNGVYCPLFGPPCGCCLNFAKTNGQKGWASFKSQSWWHSIKLWPLACYT
jgi:hypothetical protein